MGDEETAGKLPLLEQLALEAVIRSSGVEPHKLPYNDDGQPQRERLDLLDLLLAEHPQVVEAYVDYVLIGTHSPVKIHKHETEPWPLGPSNLELSVDFLYKLGHTDEAIAKRIVEAIGHGPTPAGVLKTFMNTFSGDPRLDFKGEHPDLHVKIWQQFPGIVTSAVILEAVEGLSKAEDYSPLDPDGHYKALVSAASRFKNGKFKKEITNPDGSYLGTYTFNWTRDFRERKEKLDTILHRIGQSYESMHGHNTHIQRDVIKPLWELLKDFREEMGTAPYRGAGYQQVNSPLYDLECNAGKLQKEVSANFKAMLEEIKGEQEQLLRKKGGHYKYRW
jgi:hypothetical protein